MSAARSSIARLQNARDTLVERSRASTDGAASSARLAALLEEAVSAAQVKKLARARHLARRQKDWKTADAIRDHLKKCGVQFEDISDGVRYKLP